MQKDLIPPLECVHGVKFFLFLVTESQVDEPLSMTVIIKWGNFSPLDLVMCAKSPR